MFGKIFNPNKKQLKKLEPIVAKINELEEETKKLSDEEIKEKTEGWKEALRQTRSAHHKQAQGDKEEEGGAPRHSELDSESGATADWIKKQEHLLDEILPEAYALVREAAGRALGQRHYNVQLMAGLVLHQGKIAEQKTGEGKTLTATLPLYLNSLTGRGVHLVTPNDYLSRHGAGWMGPVYEVLGVSVGVIMQEKAFVYDSEYEGTAFEDAYAVHLKEVPRQEAYQCDVVYGTNHEFGFDYLRDNMVRNLSEMAQTDPNGDWGIHNFAIVDEVDSILIDVARTPLIISAPDTKPSERYAQANGIIKSLTKDTDYEVDEKFRHATLTDFGVRRVERLLGVNNLYEQDFEMVHLIEQALIANTLYEKDKDYVVKASKVVIVDQFTGRLLPSNRFSHGLHQAIESKEGVTIQQESKTLAEISYQNYFRMYKKLSGMTGTAATEAEEFYKIYNLDVVVIPTNKPIVRTDRNDVVYKTEAAKFKAVADEIEERHKKGQPVLVGTTSVDRSELLHSFLQRRKIPHEILNAKNHEREALIIAQAGAVGAVTISTNMAGRGVDIILGGDPPEGGSQEKVKGSGGLYVIGTERHDSRRIDNQLRGRSGRQGDPGGSRFFISLQDDLMRIFGGERVQNVMDRFGLEENVPLEAGIVTKSIESAQKRVEGFNFDRRKQLVEMDDIINVHREVIYKLRRRFLKLSGNSEHKEWIVERLSKESSFDSGICAEKEKEFGEESWFKIVAGLGLPVIDMLWMAHLVDMDQVREGIGLRGYAQRDPMVEYKREGHERFEILLSRIYNMVGGRLASVTKKVVPQREAAILPKNVQYQKGEFESGVSEEAQQIKKQAPTVVDSSGREFKVEKVESGIEKVGRNDPCPCGSGLKYKRCHGKDV